VREPAGEETRSHTPDARLADALRPAVSEAMLRAVRDEPRSWAEVLFPILLPAVRLAVTSALRGMVDSLNQVLEQSLSLRSWKWRFEAWRTGKTFAEVALLRTLVYRVEQVLLVDRRAGLLLASVTAANVVSRDSRQMAAMLTALQDFVGDSFAVDTAGGIHEVHVGDFRLLIEVGPQAALAAAVRGSAPAEVRETLRAAVDLIHQEFVAELRDFRDDAKPFERSATILEGCLLAQYQKPAYSYTKAWIFAAVILLAVASWMWLRLADERRWERALTALRGTQGIAVTQSDRGRRILGGLADPLAPRPDVLLANTGIDVSRVSLHFQPYLSLDPELVVRRARLILEAPDTARIALDHGALTVSGSAGHAWILQARSAAPRLAFLGIRGVQMREIADQDMDSLRAEIESGGALFDVDSTLLSGEQLRAAKTLAARSRQWVDYALALGKVPRVKVHGYADPTGTEDRNRILSRQRAERLSELLVAAGVLPAQLSIDHSARSSPDMTDLALQRRAVVRLTLSDKVFQVW
jgi:outer membrane protein OmpA-like peptidoglycan-associated protein